MKRHSIHFRAGDLRPGTGQRRLQAPWRNVSEMSETSKQWIHPGSGGAKRRQVPAFPLNRGMSRSDRGLRQTESLHPSTRKPGRQGPGKFACGRRDSNPYALLHQILSLGCLPIPTRPRDGTAKIQNYPKIFAISPGEVSPVSRIMCWDSISKDSEGEWEHSSAPPSEANGKPAGAPGKPAESIRSSGRQKDATCQPL